MPNDSTVKFRADISQLKAQMQAAERQIRLVNSEFKAATSGMDAWGSSADGVSAKTKQLTGVLDAQRQKLALMEKELEATVKVYGENSAAADNVRIKINNQKAAIAKTEAELNKYNQKLEEIKTSAGKAADGTEDFSSETDKLKSKINEQQNKLNALKQAYVNLQLEQGDTSEESRELAKEIDELSKELQENKTKLSEAEKAADELDNSLDEVEDSSKKAGDGFTVMKGVLANLVADGIRRAVSAFKDLAVEAFNAGANFESAMSKVGAISGASTAELDALTKKAKEMGETTKFSATESAEAFNYMAMAGWKTEDMIDGIEGIMNLAAASGEDLATTSDIVTDALTAMGYSAGDAGRLADVMAAASSNANTNVAMMGATFQYAAPIVGALGMNMEDTAVAIGMMANAGIKGEKAGTALRSILTRLSTDAGASKNSLGALGVLTEKLGVEFYNTDGTVRDLNKVLVEARKKWKDLSAEQQTQYGKTIAGQEALSGWLALMNGADADFDKLTDAVNKSTGAAKNMADTMNDNVQGQITLLKSNIEGKMIKVFEKAAPAIKNAVGQISRALDSMDWNKISKGVGNLAEKFADFVTYLVKNSGTIKTILTTIGTLLVSVFAVNKIATFTQSIMALIPAFTSLLSPIGLVTTAIGLMFGAAIRQEQKNSELIKSTWGLSEAQEELVDSINSNYEAQKQLIEERDKAIESIAGEYGYIKDLKKEYNSLIDSNGEIKAGYEDRANFILNELANALGVEIDKIKEEYTENGKLSDSIDELIRKKQAEATLQAYSDSYAEAKANEKQVLDEVVQAQNEYVKAQQKTKDAQDELAKANKDLDEAMRTGVIEGIWIYQDGVTNAMRAVEAAKDAENELKNSLDKANEAYTNSQTTIQNYEGLGAAIISEDSFKIQVALDNLTHGFKTATNSRREELEQQVKDFQKNYEDIKAAMDAGNPVITQKMVDDAKALVEKAETELSYLPPKATETGEKTGQNFADGILIKAGAANLAGSEVANSAEQGINSKTSTIANDGTTAGSRYAKNISAQAGAANTAGANMASNAEIGVNSQNKNIAQDGTTAAEGYIKGIDDKQSKAKTAGSDLAGEAKKGADSVDFEESGSHAGKGFLKGIGSWIKAAWEKGKELAKAALSGARDEGEEGSPWHTTIRSGQWYGEGFIIGLNSTIKDVVKSAANMAAEAYDALDNNDDFEELGLVKGQNFANGLMSAIDDIKNVATPLDDIQVNGDYAKNVVKSSNSSFNNQSGTSPEANTQIVNFNQYNTSPKALNRLDIYRDTNSLLFDAKVRLGNV